MWIKSHLWQGTRQQRQQQRKTKSAVGRTELLPQAFGIVIYRCWCCYFCIHCYWRWQAFSTFQKAQEWLMLWLCFGLGPQTWSMVVVYCVSKGCDLLCIKGLWFIVYNWVVIYCVLKGCDLLCIKGFEENDTQLSFSLGSILNCNSKHAWKWSNWMRWLCVCGQDMIHKMDMSYVTAIVCVWRWIASEWDACVCEQDMKWTCNCAWRWTVNEWAVVCVDRTWPMKWTCLTGCWAVSSEAVCDIFTFFPLLCGFLFHAATACFFWVSSVCL